MFVPSQLEHPPLLIKNGPPTPDLNEVCPPLAGEEGVNLLVQRRPVVGEGVTDHAPARAPVAYRAVLCNGYSNF